MFRDDDPSGRLTEELKNTSLNVEATLKSCALATEGGDFESARRIVNIAASQIRSLQRLMHQRRGKPRDEVKRAIAYYSAWQTASVGRLEVTKTDYRSHTGFQLLRNARGIAHKLSQEYHNTKQYADLVDMIDAWIRAAERRTIEASSD